MRVSICLRHCRVIHRTKGDPEDPGGDDKLHIQKSQKAGSTDRMYMEALWKLPPGSMHKHFVTQRCLLDDLMSACSLLRSHRVGTGAA